MIDKKKLSEDIEEFFIFFKGILFALAFFSFIGWVISFFGLAFIASASPEYRGYVAIVVILINIIVGGIWFMDRYKKK